ncbi:MAG: FtsX-like permease family protein [Saprospiraceae bacterium]
MKLLKLAYRNIVANPLNLILSIILFGLGIGLINFLILFNNQLKDKFEKNLADIDLVIGAKGSPLQMILSSMYHIDSPTGNITIGEAKAFLNPRHPLIKAVVPLSLGDSYKSYRIVGTTDSMLSFYNTSVIEGNLWHSDFEVAIGRAVADDTGLTIGDTFHSSHGFTDDEDFAHDDSSFKVVGILSATGSVIDQLILTNPSTVWNVHDHAHESDIKKEEEPHNHEESETDENHEGHNHEDHNHEGHEHSKSHIENNQPYAHTIEDLLKYPEKDITTLLIKYKSKTNFQALNMPRAINENTDMQTASPAIEINRLYAMIGIGRQMIQWLAILIALISAISIFIMLFKSMKERKYELALIRVLGGSRTSIFALIILEGIILTLIGFLVGFLLSHLGMELLSNSLKSAYKYAFSGFAFMKEELLLLGVSLFIGVLAAFIPAWQAARTDINETLSEKG